MTMPPDPLRPADTVSQLLRHTHRGFMRSLESRLARHGIPTGTWFLLRVLWDNDGLSQAELSERAGNVGPTTVTTIDRMVRDGFVLRKSDPSDGRKVQIVLTEKARNLRSELLPTVVEVTDSALAGLPEGEIEQLKATLRRIGKNLGSFISPAFLAEIEDFEAEQKRKKRTRA